MEPTQGRGHLALASGGTLSRRPQGRGADHATRGRQAATQGRGTDRTTARVRASYQMNRRMGCSSGEKHLRMALAIEKELSKVVKVGGLSGPARRYPAQFGRPPRTQKKYTQVPAIS